MNAIRFRAGRSLIRLTQVFTLAALPVLAIPGCGGDDAAGVRQDTAPPPDQGTTPELFCATYAVAGVMVSAHDATTGAPLNDLTGTATSPTWREELKPSVTSAGDGRTQLVGLEERAGDFTIVVRRAGYADHARDIRIAKDASGCHVDTVKVEAAMQPAR